MTGVLNMLVAGSGVNAAGSPGGPLTVSIKPVSSQGSGAASPGSTAAVTAYVSGGSGSYSYAWSIIATDIGAISVSSPSARSTAFVCDAPLGAASGTARVTVTDNVTGETGTADAAVGFQRTS